MMELSYCSIAVGKIHNFLSPFSRSFYGTVDLLIGMTCVIILIFYYTFYSSKTLGNIIAFTTPSLVEIMFRNNLNLTKITFYYRPSRRSRGFIRNYSAKSNELSKESLSVHQMPCPSVP